MSVQDHFDFGLELRKAHADGYEAGREGAMQRVRSSEQGLGAAVLPRMRRSHEQGGITMYLDVWQIWLLIVCCVSGGASVGFIVAALMTVAKG